MSEPLWCDVRGHYCRCHDFGRRCDEDTRDEVDAVAALKWLESMGESESTPQSDGVTK